MHKHSYYLIQILNFRLMVIFLLYTRCINDFFLTGLFKTGFKKESWLQLCTQTFLTAAEGSVRKPTTNAILPFSAHIFI